VFGAQSVVWRLLATRYRNIGTTNALIVFVVPIFLYLDARSLQTTDWAPNPLVYFTLGIIGVILSPLIFGVATRYLYLRYKHVGFG
jgi:NhaP-type Na+/H+ or K+/H+ antiporter